MDIRARLVSSVLLVAASAFAGSVYEGQGERMFYLPLQITTEQASSPDLVTRFVDHGSHIGWSKAIPSDMATDVGTDFGVVRYTAVVAATSGTVVAICDGYPDNENAREPDNSELLVRRKDGGGWGNHVIIKSIDSKGNRIVTLYAHLEQNSAFFNEPGKSPGFPVLAGDPIGKVGRTGNAYGYHLHFQIYRNPPDFSPTRFDYRPNESWEENELRRGGRINPNSEIIDPYAASSDKQWWVSQNATPQEPLLPPGLITPVKIRCLADATGVSVAGATCRIGDLLLGTTNLDGVLFLQKQDLGPITSANSTPPIIIDASRNQLKAKFPFNLFAPTEVDAAGIPTFTLNLKPESTSLAPRLSLSNGDVVEVYGTGDGLRARYPDPTSERPKVMADGAIGTVIGGPVTGDGYVRWKIQYDALPGIEAWSAEGEPSTGQMFLRKKQGASTGVPLAPAWVQASAQSTSQIDVSWTNQAANATGIRVFRSTEGGPYESVKTLGSSVSAWTDNNRAAGATYSYRLRAFNAAGESKDSNIATAKTPPATGGIYSLAVDAVDPVAFQYFNINISSWIGVSSDLRTNTTSFTRTAPSGAQLSVSAPATLSGSRYFQYWLIDGQTKVYNTTAPITMNGNHGAIAVYGTTPPPARMLSSMAIEGPSSVTERDSATYRAKATFSDGSSAYVTPNWEEDSTATNISSGGVLDAGAVTEDKTVDLKATYSSGGVQKIGRKEVTIRNTDAKPTYRLTLNASHGEIWAFPGSGEYAAGTKVRLQPHPDDGYTFTGWSGDADDDDDFTTYVTMNGNRSVTASFAVDTSSGDIRVTCLPSQAAAEGAGFKVSGQGMSLNNWQPSGQTVPNWKPGSVVISFKDIPDWVTPDSQRANVVGGRLSEFTGTYREILGSLHVVIEPPEAATAGARWRLQGEGVWRDSGATVGDVSPGSHMVEFGNAAGWQVPSPQSIDIQRGQVFLLTGAYVPPAGLPLITHISPNTGPLEGGVPITIEAANFAAGTTVSFGGTAATSVVVESSTRLTCVLPPNAHYGTVAVALVSRGQTATKAGGFTYDIPLGMNMTLLSQIGGNVISVGTTGNLVLYGEGSSLVSADFTNPNSPVVRGRLPLPGLVRDIEIVGNHALVANRHWGLQIVDITDPAAMRRVGFYDTPGSGYALSVSGNIAFIADGPNGVQAIDFTDPTAPVWIGNYATYAYDIGLTTIGNRRVACVPAFYDGVRILDVTDPANITQLSVVEAGPYNDRCSVDGTLLLVNGALNGDNSNMRLTLYDISDPAHPMRKSQPRAGLVDTASLMRSGLLYTGDDDLDVYDISNPASPSRKATLDSGADAQAMALSGTTLLIAAEDGGLIAVDVANSFAPKILSTINQSFSAEEIALNGSAAYIGESGQVIDVANRTDPKRLNGEPWTGNLENLLHNDGFLFGTTPRGGLSALSLANPVAPVFASNRFSKNYVYAAALLGQHVILGSQTANYQPLLVVFDGTNVQNSTPLSSLQISPETGTISEGLATSGNIVFAIIQGRELRLYDYTNLAVPQFLGSTPFTGIPNGMVVSPDGKYLFVSNYQTGLSVFDCSDRTTPRLLTTYARNDVTTGYSVAISGAFVFYGDQKGLNVLDCSDPAHPALVAAYDTPGLPENISVQGDHVFVADAEAGMEILRLGDVNDPVIEITSPVRNSRYETSSGNVDVAGTASDAQGVSRVTWFTDKGGSGVARGTANWTVTGIPLAAGMNVITVTAEDGNGNAATDAITVTVTLPDMTAPVVTITGPKPDTEFATQADALTVSGSVADDRQVTSVNWTDNYGHTGSAILTGQSWRIEGVALEIGPNVITVTATDAAGNSAMDVATVLRTPVDAEAPSIAISFPTSATEFATAQPVLNVSGDASDDVGVKQIRWSNSRGGSGIATGTTLWAVNGIALQAGLNSVTLTVEDEAGKTAEDNLAVTYTPSDADGDGIADAWEMKFFGNISVVSRNTDTGFSGVSDFLKFALGIDPLQPNTMMLPKTSIDVEGPNTYLTLKYRQLMVPGELVYRVGVSRDLMSWDYSESQIEQIGSPVPTGDGLTEEVTVRLAVPLELEQSFLRLRVNSSP